MKTTFTVIGAGHGGLAMAGHLGLMGFPVRLWARNRESLAGVACQGGVTLQGAVSGFGPVTAHPSLRRALHGSDVILVVVPASAHGEIAELCAPLLSTGQKVLLLPGRTAGAIEFLTTLRRCGCKADITVGEAQTFLYASRKTGPGEATIYGIKRTVAVSAVPARRTGELLKAVRPAFPQFLRARWIWQTSLNNIGAIFHPAPALLNTARIESTGGAFRHYLDGITPMVAGLLERLDAERLSVAGALGVRAVSARDWLAEVYGVEEPTLYEAIQATPAYQGVGAPASMETRYVWEDVPTGLVPLAELGSALGVCTPTIDMVVDLACTLTGHDFRQTGRTLRRLGMSGWNREQLCSFALEGEVTARA